MKQLKPWWIEYSLIDKDHMDIQSYWTALRNSWNDTFVLEVIKKMHDLEFVLGLGQSIGYSEADILRDIDKLENRTKDLGWKIFDFIWRDAFHRLLEISKPLGFEVEHMPLVGTLPTGRINAMAIQGPLSHEYILAFEVGLFEIIYQLSDYVAIHLIPDANQQNTFNLKEDLDQEKIKKLSAALLSYYSTGMPFVGKSLSTNFPEQKALSQGFRKIIQLFIVGHEYGHIGLGHLKKGERKYLNLISSVNYSEIQAQNHEQELQADQAGFLIAGSFYVQKGLPIWFSAALIVYFLQFSQLIYEGLGFALNQKIKDNSHPPTNLRIEAVENSLFQLLKKEEERQYYYALKNMYLSLIAPLEDQLKQDIQILKDHQLFVPAASWRQIIENNKS